MRGTLAPVLGDVNTGGGKPAPLTLGVFGAEYVTIVRFGVVGVVGLDTDRRSCTAAWMVRSEGWPLLSRFNSAVRAAVLPTSPTMGV